MLQVVGFSAKERYSHANAGYCSAICSGSRVLSHELTSQLGGAICAPYPLLRAVLLYHVYFVHGATDSESAARGEVYKERSSSSRVKLYCSSHGRILLRNMQWVQGSES